jgi:hypothetical protein
MLRLPVMAIHTPVLDEQQEQQLRRFVARGGALLLPQPPGHGSIKQQLALATHARLFGSSAGGGGDDGSSDGLEGLSGAAGSKVDPAAWRSVLQRPELPASAAARLGPLRDYLGRALLVAYESRSLSLRKLFMSGGLLKVGGSSCCLHRSCCPELRRPCARLIPHAACDRRRGAAAHTSPPRPRAATQQRHGRLVAAGGHRALAAAAVARLAVGLLPGGRGRAAQQDGGARLQQHNAHPGVQVRAAGRPLAWPRARPRSAPPHPHPALPGPRHQPRPACPPPATPALAGWRPAAPSWPCWTHTARWWRRR